MFGLISVVVIQALAAMELRLAPGPYEHDVSQPCVCNEEAASEALNSWYVGSGGPPEIVARVDLNNDGRCELLMLPPQSFMGTGGASLMIYIERDGQFVHIGETLMGTDGYSLGKSKNGFARIWNRPNLGRKTSPAFALAVYAYDGNRYEVEYVNTISHGQVMDWAAEALKGKHFAKAEKWYRYAYAMWDRQSLADANNLALVLLKRGKPKAAIDLLTTHLASQNIKDEQPRDLANAHYNLGLAAEKRSDLPQTWKHYYSSAQIEPTKDRLDTLKRLAPRVSESKDFKRIW